MNASSPPIVPTKLAADYRALQNVTTNPATYGPALAVLWSDLMQRSRSVALPTLLAIARNPAHPYAAPARAEDLAGLPPTFISTGSLDLFLEEDLEYARRLLRAGVPVDGALPEAKLPHRSAHSGLGGLLASSFQWLTINGT